jgi:hypothetical protein
MAGIPIVDVVEESINGDAPVAGGAAAAAVVHLEEEVGVPDAGVGVAAGVGAAGGGGVRAMRWTNNTSGFVLRRMAALVTDGSRPDKVFKEKDVNLVAKALKDWCGEVVTSTQVYNHLRKWRQKWAKVSKLRDLSAALWDDTTNAIMLEHDHYLGHCKVETSPSVPTISCTCMCLNQPMSQTAGSS